MTVTYVGSFPLDPEKDLKNFHRKQAEYEAAWRRTGDPLAVKEAVRHVHAARQLLPDWLATAVGDIAMRGRTDREGERFRERMRHVRRYQCVQDLRRKHTKDRALDLAVERLKAKGEPAKRSTIEKSYDKVSGDLKRRGKGSEYHFLVVRSDPTIVPVLRTQGPGGEVIINGVTQSRKVTVT